MFSIGFSMHLKGKAAGVGRAVAPETRSPELHWHLVRWNLHAKRVLSLANATLGVLTSASLAIHAVGSGLAQAMGTLTKHGVKQVDRLLSNRGVDVWTLFAYWTPYVVGARTEMIVALDWTSFAADEQETIVLSMVTGHGRATPCCGRRLSPRR